MAKVLVVDDEESIVWSFRKLLESMGHVCLSSGSGERAVILAKQESPDLVVLDVKLPGIDGLTALEEIRRTLPNGRFLVMTAHGTLDTALRAHKLGANEYLLKPLDLDVARDRITTLLTGSTSDPEVEAARRKREGTSGIVGRSAPMQEVFKRVAAVSQSDATVLIAGESGTGKELLARAIHHNGPRASGPFEAINCAAIPETLLESELYGHELGAFTGAVRAKPGKFEIAHGGAVFLDEIGDLSPPAQVKLLRFLEDRRLTRVGATSDVEVDVRIIAATNQNLERLIRDGRFREDLYFRLNVVRIDVPPLKDRLDDLPLLVAHFLENRGGAGIAKDAVAALRKYDWPGNIRELRNAIERGAVLARGSVIRVEHLPSSIVQARPRSVDGGEADLSELVRVLVESAPDGGVYDFVESAWEKPLLKRILVVTQGNQVKASELLGINRATLKRKMDQYGL